MSIIKWIGAGLGWAFGGPIGAIIGIAIGSMVDNNMGNNGAPLLGERQYKNRRNRKTARPKYRSNSYKRQQTRQGDFEISLLILSTIVIKADGRQDQRELEFVQSHFVKLYGKDKANQVFNLFKKVNQQQISTRQVCLQIRQMMDHASRLQLIHFLFGIAKADGLVSDDEVNQIYTISGYLGINNKDFTSIKEMFHNERKSAYKILEIDESASDDEVKKAYRKMAKKYHPDRVSHLGEDHVEGAEEKFRQVQEAYEFLQKERGF